MAPRDERKKRMTAALWTVAVNVVVFIILFFAAAWTTAGSGDGDYPGIEVNLGYMDEGSGNIQPKEEIGSPVATDDQDPPAKPVESEPKQETAAPTVQEESNVKVVQPNTVTDPNSDVEIKEEKKEVKPAEKTPEKPVVKEKPAEKKPEEPVIDNKAVYKGKTNSNPTATGDGEGKKGVEGSEGDDQNKTGDKGVEGGTEGAAIYKGTPGGGDGGSIVLNGWDWDRIETPKVPENETGRVVFQIEVNSEGDVIRIVKESGSVSSQTESACKAAIQKITFTKKPGASVPDVTRGRITFVIRSQ